MSIRTPAVRVVGDLVRQACGGMAVGGSELHDRLQDCLTRGQPQADKELLPGGVSSSQVRCRVARRPSAGPYPPLARRRTARPGSQAGTRGVVCGSGPGAPFCLAGVRDHRHRSQRRLGLAGRHRAERGLGQRRSGIASLAGDHGLPPGRGSVEGCPPPRRPPPAGRGDLRAPVCHQSAPWRFGRAGLKRRSC
jgi:hypothetical protein